ncbi:tetratricopeptide repeat protein [Nocardia bovistercoris]|uniref:Tetratricopeptide repeat protein n=1 Tax=Nocardia bovistercoris TaxID=2785916 RepID=A0A931N1G4_9NOCA|nr:tetratricopeptide repeat protein [Nocardia bovistercoris]MBH0775939.1 tetratricopeptide repeat protein [Nocardia bovistercoris]
MSPNRFRILRTKPALVATLACLIAAVVTVTVALPGDPPATPQASTSSAEPLAAEIDRSRARLDRVPNDPAGWAALGAAYVELARITGDPENYGHAQRALDRSLELRPDGNAEALLGHGLLSNALHDFTAARRYAEQALALRPNSADVYGVLVDARTQLGDIEGATAAVQRMLDLRPSVASFTRAAYDLELHGRVADARAALDMALGAATTADQIAFCRYHLGELAFDAGDLDGAETHYSAGLLAAPQHAALHQGMAKVVAARGDFDGASSRFAELTQRTPLPEYLIEWGELLEAAGRPEEAAAKYREVSARFAELEARGAIESVDAARLAAEHGDPAEAVRLARLEFDRRQSVFTADALAWSLHKAGRDTEAIVFADRAATLGWRNATHAYHRGMILTALGRPDQAAAALSDALTINPHFSPLHAPRARRTLDTLTTR